ncbi:MAG: glycoside hydrolase [Verrucomicrobiales bacterium]|nr:glycoside hydrolase [Verrucomicrobiales bacterium]
MGPNIRLGEDPSALPTEWRAQAEPHIIRSPANPNLLVATFQEGRFVDGGAVDCGYSISNDGGLTWSRSLIPHLSNRLDDGAFDRVSDPVAAIDLNGVIYLNTLGVTGTPAQFRSSILLSRSTDTGMTLSAPNIIAASLSTTNFLDKNWVAINTFERTRTANRIAVAFTYPTATRLSVGMFAQPIVSTYSDDGGQTWSPLRFVSSPACIGAQPIFLPDGALAIIYWSFVNENGTSFEDRIEVALSADGGGTFDSPRLVARPAWHDDPIARDGFNLPSVATDHRAGVLYATYQGRSRSTPRIFFTKSIDRGQTWSAPVAVSDTPLSRSVFNAAIAVSPDGQHVSIIFYDKRNDDGSGNWVDLYLAESFDGGDTWQPNLQLSEVSSDLRRAPLTDRGRMLGDYQAIAADVDFETPAVACWIDTRTGSPDPFAVRIGRPQGTTFETWRQLRFSPDKLADAGISGPTADADHDGIPNLAEYVFALEPGQADEPAVVLDLSAAGGEDPLITFRYARLRTLADVALSWEASPDLAAWQAARPITEQTAKSVDPLLENVTLTFRRSERVAEFFRLVISPNPALGSRF